MNMPSVIVAGYLGGKASGGIKHKLLV